MENDKLIYTKSFISFYRACCMDDLEKAKRLSLEIGELVESDVLDAEGKPSIEAIKDMFIRIGALAVVLETSVTVLKKLAKVVGAEEEMEYLLGIKEIPKE